MKKTNADASQENFSFSYEDGMYCCRFDDGQWVAAYWDHNEGEKDWTLTGGSSAWAGDWLGEYRSVSSKNLCFVSVFELDLPKELSDRATKEFKKRICEARPSVSTHDSYYSI